MVVVRDHGRADPGMSVEPARYILADFVSARMGLADSDLVAYGYPRNVLSYESIHFYRRSHIAAAVASAMAGGCVGVDWGGQRDAAALDREWRLCTAPQ